MHKLKLSSTAQSHRMHVPTCAGGSNYDVSLNFDNPSKDTKKARRTKACCLPNPNRCNPPNNGNDPNNNSCDEYPFASTSNADDVQQTTRCIPGAENSSMLFLQYFLYSSIVH